MTAIRPFVSGPTQDFNALRTLLDRPSQHVWVTFQEDCMWWRTVLDEVQTDAGAEAADRGHFWLTCASAWSNYSADGARRLSKSELPGNFTAVAGFRATVCEPSASGQILRAIQNEDDPEVRAAETARHRYQDAVARLIARLGPKDFEVLIDLILARNGWARLAKVGGTRADIDIEVENASIEEIAFVQVKSTASQATLEPCVSKFREQSGRYNRMFFVFDHVDDEAEAAADAEGLADIEAGRVIPHEEVAAWLETWGAPDEEPMPPLWLKSSGRAGRWPILRRSTRPRFGWSAKLAPARFRRQVHQSGSPHKAKARSANCGPSWWSLAESNR